MTLSDDAYEHWRNMAASKAEALTAFIEAKFGMFIHWGLYAIPAGVWKGLRMDDDGIGPRVAEWIMRRRSIPRAEYAALASRFNPTGFDADAWAKVVDDAGMKYMVITAKHHDGFSLFDSACSDHTMTRATPFGRDVIDELHGACRRKGIRFGLYYSHSLDWHDGGNGAIRYAADPTGLKKTGINDWDPSPRPFEDYLREKSLPQVEELARRYPDLFLLWFDFAGYLPEAISFDFLANSLFEEMPPGVRVIDDNALGGSLIGTMQTEL